MPTPLDMLERAWNDSRPLTMDDVLQAQVCEVCRGLTDETWTHYDIGHRRCVKAVLRPT